VVDVVLLVVLGLGNGALVVVVVEVQFEEQGPKSVTLTLLVS
jgi:hypothetical protein